jgi:hypothetical protein
MTTREAACSCRSLRVFAEGEPVRVSMCHCLACQRRTGSAFGFQARYPRDRVRIEGASRTWVRTADSGNRITFHFCPECGSTVFYFLQDMPGVVAVAAGAFADPSFPSPQFSVYESRRHSWVEAPAGAERHD